MFLLFIDLLYKAVFCNHTEYVRNNIQNISDINAQYSGFPLIAWASVYDRGEILELLLKTDADVNRRGKYCQTALHIAAALGNVEVVKILLANGADANMKDEEGKTAADRALEKGREIIVNLINQC